MKEVLAFVMTAWVPRIGAAVAVFVGFWILSSLVSRAVSAAARRARLPMDVAALLSSSTRIAGILFGFVSALGTLGVDVSALVAGLGLTGFALGFALRDTVSNLVAGVLLLVYRPFRSGDSIQVTGFKGQVVSIDLRYTTLRTDGGIVLIPNSNLFTNPIVLDRTQPDEPALSN